MPSLHVADALIIGVALAALVQPSWLKLLWALWPVWVGFSVMVSGNHLWSDIAVAALLTAVTVPATAAHEDLRREQNRGFAVPATGASRGDGDTFAFGLCNIRISNYRSAREVTFARGRLCALVGSWFTGTSLRSTGALIRKGAAAILVDASRRMSLPRRTTPKERA
jgi:PAP2 superfamily